MGEVYLAQDTTLDRKVALKVLPADVAANKERMRRFIQEAKAASGLNHPNILTIFEVGEVDSVNFIATEFIDGETLRRHMSGAQLKISQVLAIASQVADGLAAAHEAGIVHRDIKPENIMVRRRDGYIKVLDFGLAKLTEAGIAPVDTEAAVTTLIATDPNVVIGTVEYMSPEQARGQVLDARTDIFSLGVVLYEITTGRTPFAGATKPDVLASILNSEPPPMGRYSKGVPETLEWIVSKALRKDREERYQTAKELLTDIRSLKQRLEFEAEQERSIPPNARSETDITAFNAPALGETVEDQRMPTDGSATHPTSSAEYLVGEIKRHKRGFILTLAALVLAIAAIILGLKYAGRNLLASGSEAFGKIKLTRLTTTGKGRWAAISPDGKYVAHVMGDAGKHAIWLRHIATGSDKEIAPSTGVAYVWPTFSHDGSYVYYAKAQTSAPSVLYQVPVLGGAPRTIIEDVDSVPTFSPDDKRLAFIRGYPAEGTVALVVANIDGTGEQKLATYDISNFFPGDNGMGPAWSPDGAMIIIRVPASDAEGVYWQMLAIKVKDGAATRIGSQRWASLGQFAWLADESGLIFTGSDQPGAPQQIWYISYPGGEARRITNDLNDYRGLSLTADSTALVTVPFDSVSSVWIAPATEAGQAQQLTSSRYDGREGVAFALDGRVLYTSRKNGNPNVWIMNADGTGQKQLTVDAHDNLRPAATADGRYIVFESNRAGTQNIWRMDMDGANPKQLTFGRNDQLPQCSPDSQWVVYASTDGGKPRLKKVAIAGGDPVELADYSLARPTISPDGKQIACAYTETNPPKTVIALIAFAGGQPLKKFDIPIARQRVRWAPDGQALTYVLNRDGIANIWSQPVDGGKAVQLTAFKSDFIYSHEWSRDGRQLLFARGTVTSDVVLINNSR
jgi:serine/threonine protein kinase/Tol biopolymer transport system component